MVEIQNANRAGFETGLINSPKAFRAITQPDNLRGSLNGLTLRFKLQSGHKGINISQHTHHPPMTQFHLMLPRLSQMFL